MPRIGKGNKVVCCHGCGRDTTAKGGYCARCMGQGNFVIERDPGHKQRPWRDGAEMNSPGDEGEIE